jgi:hypothetical protein
MMAVKISNNILLSFRAKRRISFFAGNKTLHLVPGDNSELFTKAAIT